jgi:hypothetical protein
MSKMLVTVFTNCSSSFRIPYVNLYPDRSSGCYQNNNTGTYFVRQASLYRDTCNAHQTCTWTGKNCTMLRSFRLQRDFVSKPRTCSAETRSATLTYFIAGPLLQPSQSTIRTIIKFSCLISR